MGPDQLQVIRNPQYTFTLVFRKFYYTIELSIVVLGTFQSIDLHISWELLQIKLQYDWNVHQTFYTLDRISINLDVLIREGDQHSIVIHCLQFYCSQPVYY